MVHCYQTSIHNLGSYAHTMFPMLHGTERFTSDVYLLADNTVNRLLHPIQVIANNRSNVEFPGNQSGDTAVGIITYLTPLLINSSLLYFYPTNNSLLPMRFL